MILLIYFLFLTGHADAKVTSLDRLEASVNSSLILSSDIKKFRKTSKLRLQLDPLFAGTSLAEKGDKASDAEITDFLISERVITQEYPVNDTEVEQEINSIQANNRLDRAALKNALATQGFSFEDYFELIKVSISKKYLIERDIKTKVSVTDDDIKNQFYNHYSPGAKTGSTVHLQVIRISPSNFKTFAAAKDVIDQAHKSIRSGEAFEEVARRVSDDESAQAGGDLGFLPEETLSAGFRKQIKKLKLGQVSTVFGDKDSGLYIIKVKDLKTNDSEKLDKVKEELRAQIITKEYQHQIALWIDRHRQSAFIHKAKVTKEQ
jgi:peptidyl-prolyl cis-trans isomerase SurA